MHSTPLLDGLFSSPEVGAALSDRALVQAMLDFEAALAGAEAEAGIVPEAAALAISVCCRVELIPFDGLAEAAARAGNLAIPLVKALSRRVAEDDPEAERWVHWGATSQDVIDTATILQLRQAMLPLRCMLGRLEAALATLARTQAAAVMPGRTWLQHALPVTFGLKAAGWLSSVSAARMGLEAAVKAAMRLQFGGAAGTLASLGTHGLAVSEALARRLDLALPALPWHTNRVAPASVATSLGIVCGTLGKIARDLSLLMQTEVGEAFEPEGAGKGGSSTMPHKRNPVSCAIALSAAVQAPGLVATMLSGMVQEHERGLGGWHAEWQALPGLLRLAAASASQMADAAEGLEIVAAQMQNDLHCTGGLLLAEAVSMALAEQIGKAAAHRMVEEASRVARTTNRHLRDVLLADPIVSVHLKPDRINALMVPDAYLGMTAQFIERALAAYDAALVQSASE